MTAGRPSPQMQAILERLAVEDAGLPDPTLLPPAEGRAQAARANLRWNQDVPAMARVRDMNVTSSEGHDIPVRILVPEGAGPGAVFYIHGGGWAFCNMDTHDFAARALANACGVPVVLCDYRLSPEHPYPAGLNDCLAAWGALSAKTGAFFDCDELDLQGAVAVSGDSAGANLALALILAEQTAGRAAPDMGLLFYGVYGADFTTPSYVEVADGPGLTQGKMRRYWDWYVPEGPRDDPRIAPIRASDAALDALPPLYLNAAEIDPLRSDSEQLFARLSQRRRTDQFRLFGGVVHGFMQMGCELEDARLALAEAGAAYRAMASRTAQD